MCPELDFKDERDAVPVLQEVAVPVSSSVKVNWEYLTSRAAVEIK